MPAMPLSATEIRRYSRHLTLPEIGVAGQEKLQEARVLVIGTGGLGSPAALYLAAAGVGNLGVLDFDRVEESNLQRQVLYDTAAIGMPKAELARMRLAALNPELQLQAHQTELCAANVQEIFNKYDIIVDGSDRITTRYLVNDACVIYGKSLVSAAIHRFEGQAMTYVPGRGPCYRCLFPEMAEGVAPNCAEAGVLGALPGVMGAIQATEVIKLVVGIGAPLIGRLLTYDALEMRFQELRAQRRPDCAVCGDHPSISAPQDPPGFCSVEELRQVRSISAAQLAQRIKTTGLPISLIDVREPAEFAASHLPRAINIPLSTVEQHGRQLPHAGTVIFMCQSGVRSQRACALASRMGVSEAWQLEGGLLAWKAEIDPTLRL
jgi:molybdopterin/thiamine biosynthesis adenylyltransferase/rhodanese-related sulfurtransferase